MRLTVLGSSGSGPSRANPASGYLVEAGDTALWIDCGTGTFAELASRLDPATLSAVVISHVHVDHCADIFGLYGYLAYGAPAGAVSVPVFAPEGADAHLATFARADAGHAFHRVLRFATVGAGDSASAGSVTMRFGSAVHGVPALVTRVDDGAASLVYSGDTGPGGDLESLAVGCDVALVEAALGGERRSGDTLHHLTAGEAGAVARAAAVGRLIVTHLTPTLDEEVAATEAAATFGGPVPVALPGMAVAIATDDEDDDADDETGGVT